MYKKILFALFMISGLTLAQSNPKITVTPLNYDLGNIEQGDAVTKIYTIKNEGGGLLNIKDIRVSCGCTVAKPGKKDLMPGESTELSVTFNSEGREGKQSKTVFIETNDLSNSTVQVTFNANVLVKKTTQKIPKLSFTEKSYDFGRLSEGKVAQHTFNFTNTGGSTLEIGFIVTTGPGVAANISSRKIEPGKKGMLKVSFDTSNLRGKIAKSIKVGSNDPDAPSQTLILTADIKR